MANPVQARGVEDLISMELKLDYGTVSGSSGAFHQSLEAQVD